MTKPNAPESGVPRTSQTPQGNAPAWVDDVLHASRAEARPTAPPPPAPPASVPDSTPVDTSAADDLRLPDDLAAPQASRFDPDDWVVRATGGQVKDPAVPAARTRHAAPPSAPVADPSDPWAPRTDAWGEPLPTPLPVTDGPLDRYREPGLPVNVAGEVAQKRLIAGLLAIFLGAFGVHKFFLGLNAQGLTLLGVHLGTWVVALILGTLMFIVGLALTIPLALLVSSGLGVFGLVEGLILLTKSDADFQREYLIGKKPWL